MPRDPQINIRLPADLKALLQQRAARSKTSVNAEAVAAIEQWIHGGGRTDAEIDIRIQNAEILKRLDRIEEKLYKK